MSDAPDEEFKEQPMLKFQVCVSSSLHHLPDILILCSWQVVPNPVVSLGFDIAASRIPLFCRYIHICQLTDLWCNTILVNGLYGVCVSNNYQHAENLKALGCVLHNLYCVSLQGVSEEDILKTAVCHDCTEKGSDSFRFEN